MRLQKGLKSTNLILKLNDFSTQNQIYSCVTTLVTIAKTT